MVWWLLTFWVSCIIQYGTVGRNDGLSTKNLRYVKNLGFPSFVMVSDCLRSSKSFSIKIVRILFVKHFKPNKRKLNKLLKQKIIEFTHEDFRGELKAEFFSTEKQ